jgi:NAD(P)H-hydrate repair Nnr-like enzyme with NAD(P)H-hydrate epimerase domain
MAERRELENAARRFVIDALTEFSGSPPPQKAVEAAVERIVKTFEPLVSKAELSDDGMGSPAVMSATK